MKLKLDENLPDTVPQEGLAGRDDQAVWNAAQEAMRFLITQDLDFSDIRRYAPGTHHGLMIVRLRDPSRRALIRRIKAVFQTEQVDRDFPDEGAIHADGCYE